MTKRRLNLLEAIIYNAQERHQLPLKGFSPDKKLNMLKSWYNIALDQRIAQLGDKGALADHGAQECGLLTGFIELYQRGEAHIYKMAEQFGHHLNKTSLDMNVNSIPYEAGSMYLLEFPECVKFIGKDGERFRHCVIGFGVNDQGRSLQIAAPDYYTDDYTWDMSSVAVIRIADEGTMGDSLEWFKAKFGASPIPEEMVHFIIKSLVYIHSGKPDLQNKYVEIHTDKEKKIQAKAKKNGSMFSFVQVGYSYHGRKYHVDSTNVSGHFRWQKFGENLSQVKLIWIDEHVRKYNKQETENAESTV